MVSPGKEVLLGWKVREMLLGGKKVDPCQKEEFEAGTKVLTCKGNWNLEKS